MTTQQSVAHTIKFFKGSNDKRCFASKGPAFRSHIAGDFSNSLAEVLQALGPILDSLAAQGFCRCHVDKLDFLIWRGIVEFPQHG